MASSAPSVAYSQAACVMLHQMRTWRVTIDEKSMVLGVRCRDGIMQAKISVGGWGDPRSRGLFGLFRLFGLFD